MKNDLLYASPLDHYFSNLKKKRTLEKWLLHMSKV